MCNKAHRCETNDHPAIGVGLDDRPVHLVVRSDGLTIAGYDYTNSGNSHLTQITTGVGSPILGAGTTVAALGLNGRRVDATLNLLPANGCRANGLTATRLTTGGDVLQVTASRPACVASAISIGEVTIQ